MRSTQARIIRSGGLAIATAALVVVFPGSALGAGWRTIAQDSGRGLVTAATPVASPGSLRVVISTPAGRARIVYSTAISCDGSRTRLRRLTGRTTVRRPIAKPRRRPEGCLVASTARRRDGGVVTLRIQQRR